MTCFPLINLQIVIVGAYWLLGIEIHMKMLILLRRQRADGWPRVCILDHYDHLKTASEFSPIHAN